VHKTSAIGTTDMDATEFIPLKIGEDDMDATPPYLCSLSSTMPAYLSLFTPKGYPRGRTDTT